MPLYASTFLYRGRSPYLNEDFFLRIGASLPDQLLVILARQHGEPVATAICYRSADTLYGRYWGSTGNFHSLHFETCYYQGIDYCIANGLRSFEPGTQGEHKISRGFEPTLTWSALPAGSMIVLIPDVFSSSVCSPQPSTSRSMR